MLFSIRSPLISSVQRPFVLACTFLSALTLLSLSTHTTAFAQSIYRCGNEYTNNAASAKARGCEAIGGGNVTIVQGTKAQPQARNSTRVARAPSTPPLAGINDNLPAVASPASYAPPQRQKDNNARVILETELKITQDKLGALQREFNNGAPEKLPTEASNPAKYQERVSGMKASIDRLAGDVTSLRKELSRFGSSN